MRATLILVIIAAILLALLAFYFMREEAECQYARAAVEDRNSELQFELHRLNEELASLSQELEEEIGGLSRGKEEEISNLKETYDALLAELRTEVSEGQIKITQLADRLSVSVVDKILFPSGEAEITAEGLQVLKRVAEILGDVKGKLIQVEGHTDNVRISERLRTRFPTNWELSTARATNVVRFLQGTGVDGARLNATGFSEYRPVATNETVGGRSQNRRIEIVLLPE